MDAVYYISGFLLVLGLPLLVIAIITALAKPHLVNNRRLAKNKTPHSRGRIAALGVTTLLVSFIGVSSVIAATEPASVKADRAAREAADAKALQVQQQADAQKKAADAARQHQAELDKPVVKTETKVEAVPFESTEQNDATLPAGQKKVSVAGVNGERTITYSVTYVRGVETARTETKNEITKPPVTQVTLNGTYVKPAPAPTPASAPAQQQYSAPSTGVRTGATCNDGSHSNATGSGACSHHGGVAYWLY